MRKIITMACTEKYYKKPDKESAGGFLNFTLNLEKQQCHQGSALLIRNIGDFLLENVRVRLHQNCFYFIWC